MVSNGNDGVDCNLVMGTMPILSCAARPEGSSETWFWLHSMPALYPPELTWTHDGTARCLAAPDCP